MKEVIGRLEEARLVTVVGPGGAGKTRLVLEVAAELTRAGESVVFVDLSVVSDPSAVLPAMAAATPVAGQPPSLFEAMAGRLGWATGVVVLDNCEHVRAACAEVAEALLGACGRLRVLATTRERLGAPGEVVWRIPPLTLPDAPALPEAFVGSDAVQLFCQRAAALQPGFLPTPDNIDAIVAICRRLDGNPLAIELAAARVVALPPAEIAARLDDRFALLEAGPTTAPARQRTLRATLEWSHQLLSAPERAMLARLAVFTGSFPLDAAEEVCSGEGIEAGKVVGLLTSLVEKSLVVSEANSGAARFRLLDTVRAYAGQRLDEAGGGAELAERHAGWCVGLVKRRPGHQAGGQAQGEWLALVEAERDNLRAALEWALDQHRGELALRLVKGQMRVWERRGCFGHARQCLERVLAEAGAAPEGLRAAVLHDAAVAALMTGDPHAARDHARSSLGLAATAGEPAAEARTRSLLGFVSTFDDDPAAVGDLEQAAAAMGDSGDDVVVEALAACGQARLFRGESRVARAHFEASVQAARQRGSEALAAVSLLGLGSAETLQGDYPTAEEHLRQSVGLAAAAADTHTEVAARTALAELAQLRGAHDEARTGFEECARQARGMGVPYMVARCLVGLGRANLEAGDPEEAKPLFEEASKLAQRAALAHLAVRSLVGRAQVALAMDAPAATYLDEALALARRRADKAGEALVLEGHAELSRRQVDLNEAAIRARAALALHAEVGDPAGVARCLEALGRLAADGGKTSIAARRFGAADALRQRHGCLRSACQDAEHAAAVERLGQSVGEESFSNEWRRGAELSTESSVAEALKQRGPPRPPNGWDALTGAERTVAKLAAHGLTNTEIARRLGIAPATVKAHLRKVFAKVGVQTRAALAATYGDRNEGRR